jgi:hypothetical protein
MKKRDCLIAFLLGLGILPSALLAQQETQMTEAKRRMDVPAPLGGLTQPLTSPSEGEPGTILTAGLGVEALYDDNVAALDGSQIGHYQYSILPSIGLQRFDQETQWVLHYVGGVTFDQRALQDDLITHGGTADFRHDFSRRLATELREEYLVTNNPFAHIGTSQSLPALTGPGELSSFVVPPTATRTASVSLASLSYQLGPYSGIGISGNLSMQRYRDVIATSGIDGSLIDTRTVAGRAFYVDQISPHQRIGAEYQLQDLEFDGGLARAVDHTVFLFDEISLRNDMKLSLFAGPESSHIHNVLILNPNLSTSVVPALSDQLSWAGGIMYTWQGKHTGFSASGRRGVSDGGGFLGAVRLTTGQLEMERRITQRWILTLGTSYSDGRALDASANGTGNRITTVEGHVAAEHRITGNISVRGQYAHVDQPHGGDFSQSIRGHHNQVEIGLDYQFHRTLNQ